MERFLEDAQPDLTVNTSEIIWFHSLRNELYHGGQGVIPPMYALEGSRAAALSVFEIMFDVDASVLLNIDDSEIYEHRALPVIERETEKMKFLRSFAEFEDQVQIASSPIEGQPGSIAKLWGEVKKGLSLNLESQKIAAEAIEARNVISDGIISDEMDRDYNVLAKSVNTLAKEIQKNSITKRGTIKYGKQKDLYKVSELQNGNLEVEVLHQNSKWRALIFDQKDNPEYFLRLERFTRANPRAKFWLSVIVKNYRDYFSSGNVEFRLD